MRAMSIVLVLSGCSGGDDTDDGIVPIGDDDVEPPDDTDTTTTDTGTIDGGQIDAAYWAVTGRFVFDQDTVQHISYAVPEVGLVSMSLEFMLIDSSFLQSGVLDNTTRCLVTFKWDQPRPIAGWVEPHFAWTGFDMPDDPEVVDQCSEFFGLRAEWEGDAAANLDDWTWGVGITDLDPQVEETIENSVDASRWAAIEPYIVGGALMSSFFVGNSDLSPDEDGYTPSGFALGFSVDSNFEVEIDGVGSPVPLSNAFINSDPGVITGQYEVSMGPYTGGQLLAAGAN